jgi:hypothetical protein
MSPFERALAEEDQWLCKIVERPMPTDPQAGHRVYIGPARLPVDTTPWEQRLIKAGWKQLPPEPAV